MTVVNDFSSAAQALTETLSASIVDPADAIRLLSALTTFTPADPTTASLIGQGMQAMQSACGDLFRRTALTALARASATYQPASADDAAVVRGIVCSAIDAEIEIAGDQGEDAVFNALRALRTAVAADLASRGSALPVVTRVNTPQSLPAPVLAQRLYRDASRSDELVMEANPRHPAFMPQSFKALSK